MKHPNVMALAYLQVNMLPDLNATMVIAVTIASTWLFHGAFNKDPGSDTTCSDAEGQGSQT